MRKEEKKERNKGEGIRNKGVMKKKHTEKKIMKEERGKLQSQRV